MNKDILQRFIFENIPIRGEYVQLQSCFQTIAHQHKYPPIIQQILGEALAAAVLLSAIIKFNGRLTVQFRGKGKLKLLLAQCTNEFQIRGLAKWEGDLTYQEIIEAFQDGTLVIMLDGGGSKQRYQGIVKWQGESLAESIESYFNNSEQLPTKIWLAVDQNKAVGLLLQVVPLKEKSMQVVEKTLMEPSWEYIAKSAAKLNVNDLLDIDELTILRKLYPEEEIRIFTPAAVAFHCTCSRKRSEDAIALLGREEAEAELENKQVIVVTCDFCNAEYVFDKVDVAAIFEQKHASGSHDKLH